MEAVGGFSIQRLGFSHLVLPRLCAVLHPPFTPQFPHLQNGIKPHFVSLVKGFLGAVAPSSWFYLLGCVGRILKA